MLALWWHRDVCQPGMVQSGTKGSAPWLLPHGRCPMVTSETTELGGLMVKSWS